MKKALIAIVVIGLVGAGGYGVYHHFFAQSDSSERVSSSSEDAVYVDKVSDITGYGSGNGLIDRYSGEVVAQATLEVKLESERTVEECFVKEGDEVKEGQRLFIYETQEDEDKIAQAEIDIERAEGEIEVNEDSIAQVEKDKANASADEQLSYSTQILTLQNEIKQNEYTIKSKNREIEDLQETIKSATVTAEMDGIIQKIADPNDTSSSYTSSGDSSVYITILAAGDFRIKGSVNEQNLNSIYEGMEMVVHSRVDDTLTWKGTISEIDTDKAEEDEESSYYYGSSADSSSYAFYVELENSDDLILGQHVYMEQNLGQDETKTGLWLEEYYIVQDEETGSAYVWMANNSNVLARHEVELGEYDEEQMKYEILSGLEAEDYITMPMDTLEEGTPVIYNDFSSDTGVTDDGSYDDMDGESLDLGDDFGEMDEDAGALDGEDYEDDGALGGEEYEDLDGEEVYDADAEAGMAEDAAVSDDNGLFGIEAEEEIAAPLG